MPASFVVTIAVSSLMPYTPTRVHLFMVFIPPVYCELVVVASSLAIRPSY